MGVEITEVLHLIPAVFVVLQFVQNRYKNKCDCGEEKFVIAEMQERPNDKSAVTMELIAAMLVSKFCDHSPIHRQVNRLSNDYHYTISEDSFCR
jgi:transposase